jgi:hypothetical protein
MLVATLWDEMADIPTRATWRARLRLNELPRHAKKLA